MAVSRQTSRDSVQLEQATIDLLAEVNRRFYEEHASSFSATRMAPWIGWRQAFEMSGLASSEALEVVDLGCGNGRLLRDVCHWRGRGSVGGDLSYVGIDASLRLLVNAARSVPEGKCVRASMVASDVLRSALMLEPRNSRTRARWTVLFGVLHHVPAFETRRALLASVTGTLRAADRMTVSCWQFGEDERFTKKMRPWSMVGLSQDDVEERDFLLGWGPDASGRAVRYCHWTTPAELRELVAGLGVELVADHWNDGKSGRLNYYATFRRIADC